MHAAFALAARHEHTHISGDFDPCVKKSDESDFKLAEALSAWKSEPTAQDKSIDLRQMTGNLALTAGLASKGVAARAAGAPCLLGANVAPLPSFDLTSRTRTRTYKAHMAQR